MDISELLAKFDSGELIGLVAVLGCVFVGSLGILLGFYVHAQKTRRVETLSDLKQDMLKRGMSAEDIQLVLNSGSERVRRGLRRCFS